METNSKVQEIINAVSANVDGFEINDIILAAKKLATDHVAASLEKLGGSWDVKNSLCDEELTVCVYNPCEGEDDYANFVVTRVEADNGSAKLFGYLPNADDLDDEYDISALEPGDIEQVAKWLDDEYEFYEGELEECYVEAVRQGYISEQASRQELEDNFDEILAFRFDDCEYGPMSREFALGVMDGFRD